MYIRRKYGRHMRCAGTVCVECSWSFCLNEPAVLYLAALGGANVQLEPPLCSLQRWQTVRKLMLLLMLACDLPSFPCATIEIEDVTCQSFQELADVLTSTRHEGSVGRRYVYLMNMQLQGVYRT